MQIFLIIVVIVFFAMFFFSWAQKGNDIKDGAASGCAFVALLLVAAFTVLFVLNEVKQCSSKEPSIDYYDAPRK